MEINKLINPESRFSALKTCSPKVTQLQILGSHQEILEDEYCGLRVGIVGTRNATVAGINDAKRIAQVVSQYGGVVVSGMALGIDGAAHRGAIDAGGKTIAVLGSGVNVCYPQRHKKLSEEIINNGCLISEYDTDTKPLAWHFPIRNRIISALSDVLVVVEGTIKGGARITVDLSLAMGKTICAVPGPRRNLASELPNSIIRDGAICVLDPADVIKEIGYCGENLGWDSIDNLPTISNFELKPNQIKLLENLTHQPANHYELSNSIDLPPAETKNLLINLEKLGKVKLSRGRYEAT